LLIALVALAAGAAGGAIDRLWVARTATPAHSEAPGIAGRREPQAGSERSIAEQELLGERGGNGGGIPLSLRSLSLTDSQRHRIEKITARFQPAADSVMKDFRPVADSIMRTVRGRVAAIDLAMRQQAMCVLTPQQRDEWIAWRKREHVIVEDNNLMAKLVTTNSCPK
jgi:Spy/CpxP family protein refolding chaperone